ncbi:MAG: hypothetical protein HC828_20115 [Blastochloris sp.]|nr:hypothetical protein [Blastochloris sp.]
MTAETVMTPLPRSMSFFASKNEGDVATNEGADKMVLPLATQVLPDLMRQTIAVETEKAQAYRAKGREALAQLNDELIAVARDWHFSTSVGRMPTSPTCKRCSAALQHPPSCSPRRMVSAFRPIISINTAIRGR